MKTRFFPLALAGVAALGLAGIVQSAPEFVYEEQAPLDLVSFRVALDQIAQGNLENARVLLESREPSDMAAENALILAYLQDKAGESDRARATLEKLPARSPLQNAYFNRLGASNLSENAVLAAARRPNSPARLGNSDPKIARLEKQMLALVNAERARKGLRALVWDEGVAAVARAHSAEMRDKNYFAHESPTPSLRAPIDRYKVAQGQTPRLIAENVYRAWGGGSFLTEKGVLDGHEALMKSPGHRENILVRDATKIGIGIVGNRQNHIWITQVFVRP